MPFHCIHPCESRGSHTQKIRAFNFIYTLTTNIKVLAINLNYVTALHRWHLIFAIETKRKTSCTIELRPCMHLFKWTVSICIWNWGSEMKMKLKRKWIVNIFVNLMVEKKIALNCAGPHRWTGASEAHYNLSCDGKNSGNLLECYKVRYKFHRFLLNVLIFRAIRISISNLPLCNCAY